MKRFVFYVLFISACLHVASACSMYKVTENGKTIVGNNEDWISPNSQFWFEPGNNDKYGVMYMGLLNNFAQGAFNEAGLVFDGFANPYLAVENIEGKEEVSATEAVRHVMQSMENVKQVKQYLSTVNLSFLARGQLVFVDKKGDYLIVEGDELIIGKEAEKAFSNFYYSQIEGLDQVDLPNFKNGLKYMEETEAEASLDYCGSVMQNLCNPQDFTQYSTIYDLHDLTVRVYLFHDYSEFVEFSLKDKLADGEHRVMIAELFPETSIGYEHYAMFNDEKYPTRFFERLRGENVSREEELLENGFDGIVNTVGYEWLYDKQKPQVAISVFEYGTILMPNNANLFDSLGEAYFTNGNYLEALRCYKKSLRLNPDNENGLEMYYKIKEILDEGKD